MNDTFLGSVEEPDETKIPGQAHSGGSSNRQGGTASRSRSDESSRSGGTASLWISVICQDRAPAVALAFALAFGDGEVEAAAALSRSRAAKAVRLRLIA